MEDNKNLGDVKGKRRKMGDLQRASCSLRLCPRYSSFGHCKRGDQCPWAHGKPRPVYQKLSDNPELVAALIKSSNSSPVYPPEDPTIKTLSVRYLINTTIEEEDLRDCFSAYGDIESIRLVQEYNGVAIITYSTREAAEKCMEDLKTRVEIKGHKLRVLWTFQYKPHLFTTISSSSQVKRKRLE